MPIQSLGIFDSVFDWVCNKLFDPIIEWLSKILNSIFEWLLNNIVIPLLMPVFEFLWNIVIANVADIFFSLIYGGFCQWLWILDQLQSGFDVLIGMKDITYYSESLGRKDQTTLLEYFVNNEIIRNALISITFIALCLSMIFAIYSVMRSTLDFDFEGKRPVGKVLNAVAKSMIAFLLVPTICIFGISLASIVLKQTCSAITGSDASLGRWVLAISSMDAGRGNPPASFIDRATGQIAEPWASLVGGGLDYVSFGTCIHISRVDYILGFASLIFMAVIMVICLFTFIKRIFDIILLYITSPYFVSTIVLDDGEKFKRWRDMFIAKILVGFGSVIGLRIFLMMIPVIMNDQLEIFDSVAGNITGGYIIRLVFILGGMYAVYKSSTLLTGIISSSVAAEENANNALMAGLIGGGAQKGMRALTGVGKKAFNQLKTGKNSFSGGSAAAKKETSPKFTGGNGSVSPGSSYSGNFKPDIGGSSGMKDSKLKDDKLKDSKLKDEKLKDDKLKDDKLKDDKLKDDKLKDDKLKDGKLKDDKLKDAFQKSDQPKDDHISQDIPDKEKKMMERKDLDPLNKADGLNDIIFNNDHIPDGSEDDSGTDFTGNNDEDDSRSAEPYNKFDYIDNMLRENSEQLPDEPDNSTKDLGQEPEILNNSNLSVDSGLRHSGDSFDDDEYPDGLDSDFSFDNQIHHKRSGGNNLDKEEINRVFDSMDTSDIFGKIKNSGFGEDRMPIVMDSSEDLSDDGDNDGNGEMTFGGQDGGDPQITEAAEPHEYKTTDNIIRRMSEEAGDVPEFSNEVGSLSGRILDREHSTDVVRGADSRRREQINRNDSAEPRGQQSRFTGGHDEFAAVNTSGNVQKPGTAVPPESSPRAAAAQEIVSHVEPTGAMNSFSSQTSGAAETEPMTGAARSPEIVSTVEPAAAAMSASGARKTGSNAAAEPRPGAAKTPEIVKPVEPTAVKRSDQKNDSAKF